MLKCLIVALGGTKAAILPGNELATMYLYQREANVNFQIVIFIFLDYTVYQVLICKRLTLEPGIYF